jgi:hypothetical protein
MAVIRGQSYIVDFIEWDLPNKAPKTGDAANITVRISKDGGALTTATNSPVEVDATNAPGLYRITLTASEMDANTVEVVPKSTTANTYCQAITILTERGRVDTTVSSRTTAADVWGYSTRTLTSFGTLVSDVASAVWAYTTRTLTGFGTLGERYLEPLHPHADQFWHTGRRYLVPFHEHADIVWHTRQRNRHCRLGVTMVFGNIVIKLILNLFSLKPFEQRIIKLDLFIR